MVLHHDPLNLYRNKYSWQASAVRPVAFLKKSAKHGISCYLAGVAGEVLRMWSRADLDER